MTVVPFLVIAAIAGTGSLLLGARRGWSTAIAVLGLAAMTAAARAMGPTASVEIGGTRLVGSELAAALRDPRQRRRAAPRARRRDGRPRARRARA